MTLRTHLEWMHGIHIHPDAWTVETGAHEHREEHKPGLHSAALPMWVTHEHHDVGTCERFACGGRPGPEHGPCSEHGKAHCTADGCF